MEINGDMKEEREGGREGGREGLAYRKRSGGSRTSYTAPWPGRGREGRGEREGGREGGSS